MKTIFFAILMCSLSASAQTVEQTLSQMLFKKKGICEGSSLPSIEVNVFQNGSSSYLLFTAYDEHANQRSEFLAKTRVKGIWPGDSDGYNMYYGEGFSFKMILKGASSRKGHLNLRMGPAASPLMIWLKTYETGVSQEIYPVLCN